MDRLDMHVKIIEKRGRKLQMIKALEELEELAQEVRKSLSGKQDDSEMRTEICDVSNMLEQLIIMNNWDFNELSGGQTLKTHKAYLKYYPINKEVID